MAIKAFNHVEIKDEEKGEITAVFATLNVVDSDGDVTVKGAFENGAKVRISAYGHTSWSGRLPVGKGTIREVGDEAIMDGKFFLDTPEGLATFKVVKELGEDGLQEFSYGYDPVEYKFGEFEGQDVRFLEKLKVHEVSPVLLGAGVGTRVISAKSGGLKFSEHIELVMADVDALVERAAEVMALRSEKGKSLSELSTEQLGQMNASIERLKSLLDAPSESQTEDEAMQEYLRFVQLTQLGA